MRPFLYASGQQALSEIPEWLQEHLDFIAQWNRPDETIEIATSGSTGAPRKISMSKEKMRASARLTAEYFGLGKNSSVLLALPAAYIAGKMVIVRALTNEWQLWLTQPASNPLKELDQELDFASFTPMQMQTILSENPYRLTLIKSILVGGAEVKPHLAASIAAVHGACFETYGMTETVSHVAVRRIGPDHAPFEALPGVAFEVDERSCLIIRAAHLNNEPVVTNDVVELLDKHHFRLLGRADDVINSGGVKLFPPKIEAKLEHLIHHQYYITAAKHALLGETVVLMIEGSRPSAHEYMLLETDLKKVLDRFEYPTEIRFVPQFSRTESGKVKRIYL
jgi:O-succinylbenzoic acid--CoA ligase